MREMLEVWKLTKLRLRLTLTPYQLYAKSVVNWKRCLTSLPLTDVKMTVIFHQAALFASGLYPFSRFLFNTASHEVRRRAEHFLSHEAYILWLATLRC